MFRAPFYLTLVGTVLGSGGGVAAQPVLYVDLNATGPVHDGSSWCEAYLNLSDALEAVAPSSGTTIRVADGTYLPDRSGLGDPREATFRLVSGVTIEGRYAGCGAADPDERDLSAYTTVLSGDFNGDDIPDGGGGDSDCCEAHTTSGCGNATCQDTVCASHPLCCSGEWTTSCAVTAEGLCCELCSARNDCENSYHVVDASAVDATAVLDGLTIVAGNARGPSTSLTGGGLHGGSPTVVNCAFRGNSAFAGGAVSNIEGSPTMINCVFSGNRASIDGGAIFNDQSSLALTNCTLAGNTAPVAGGIRNYVAVDLTMTNCILWGNVADSGMDEEAQIVNTSSLTIVNHACIQGWTGAYGGIGNTGDDPRLVDAEGPDGTYGTNDDNLRLQPDSPVVDAGDNAAVSVLTDLDGRPRIVDGDGDDVPIVDMGAYESESAQVPTVSAWGLIVWVLLVLTAGTIVHRHRPQLA